MRLDELEVHHWRYELFAESVEEELATFCATHHAAIHKFLGPRSDVHFPHYVTPEIAQRIEARR